MCKKTSPAHHRIRERCTWHPNKKTGGTTISHRYTKVCEEQTHYLGEEGDNLPATIKRITISRDTPFAQRRFAEEADLDDIQYLSDYKAGEFGKSVGLLIDGPMLLARSVILVDKQGVVQYIQVVPEVTHLPDMEKAFGVATELANTP